MLAIEELSPQEIESIGRAARNAFRCRNGCALEAPRKRALARANCEACSLAGDARRADGTPNVAGWQLLYIAANRNIPRAWAPAVFRLLGDDTPHAARVRGYLLAAGTDALAFDEPLPPPVWRVRLDVAHLTGAAWDAWCDGEVAPLTADGIVPGGLADGYDCWDVPAETEAEARALIERHLTDGVTIHDAREV